MSSRRLSLLEPHGRLAVLLLHRAAFGMLGVRTGRGAKEAAKTRTHCLGLVIKVLRRGPRFHNTPPSPKSNPWKDSACVCVCACVYVWERLMQNIREKEGATMSTSQIDEHHYLTGFKDPPSSAWLLFSTPFLLPNSPTMTNLGSKLSACKQVSHRRKAAPTAILVPWHRLRRMGHTVRKHEWSLYKNM